MWIKLSFALGLALKQRRKATRKSPIDWLGMYQIVVSLCDRIECLLSPPPPQKKWSRYRSLVFWFSPDLPFLVLFGWRLWNWYEITIQYYERYEENKLRRACSVLSTIIIIIIILFNEACTFYSYWTDKLMDLQIKIILRLGMWHRACLNVSCKAS